MKRIPVLIIICQLMILSVYPQKWMEDLKKATEPYLESRYEVELIYRIYPSADSNDLIEEAEMWAVMDGANYRARYFGLEVIGTADYDIIINRSTETISISTKSKQGENPEAEEKAEAVHKKGEQMLQEFIKPFVEASVIKGKTKPSYTVSEAEEKAGKKRYVFRYEEGEYERTDLYFSLQSGLLDKLVCFMREPILISPSHQGAPRLELQFLRQEFGEQKEKAAISGSDIYSKDEKGEIQFKGVYQHYQIKR